MDPRGTPVAAGQKTVWKRIGIIFLAVVGIGAIGLMLVGFLVVRKRYPWILELGRASQEMVKRSATSPATAELNRTLCSETMVMQTADLTKLQDAMKQKATTRMPPELRWMVSCHVRDASKAPGCDQVARTFRSVVPDPGKFVVIVTAGLFRTGSKPLCAVTYRADGSPVAGTGHADVVGKENEHDAEH